MASDFDYSKEDAPVVTAVILGDIEDLQRLLDEGANINTQDSNGASALMMAIEQDWANPKWIDLLISKGIDINLQNKDGDTALDLARYFERKESIQKLITFGAQGKNGPSARRLADDAYCDDVSGANAMKNLLKTIEKK